MTPNCETSVSWPFFVTFFLGWWRRDPLKGCWWPPTRGLIKRSLWITGGFTISIHQTNFGCLTYSLFCSTYTNRRLLGILSFFWRGCFTCVCAVSRGGGCCTRLPLPRWPRNPANPQKTNHREWVKMFFLLIVLMGNYFHPVMLVVTISPIYHPAICWVDEFSEFKGGICNCLLPYRRVKASRLRGLQRFAAKRASFGSKFEVPNGTARRWTNCCRTGPRPGDGRLGGWGVVEGWLSRVLIWRKGFSGTDTQF